MFNLITHIKTGTLTGQRYLASGKSLGSGVGALEGERNKKEHTETPGVWGQMRTRGPNSRSQQQRRGDGGKSGGRVGGWGGGVKVTALRLQLHHNIKEDCVRIRRGSARGSVVHFCSKTDRLPAYVHYMGK